MRQAGNRAFEAVQAAVCCRDPDTSTNIRADPQNTSAASYKGALSSAAASASQFSVVWIDSPPKDIIVRLQRLERTSIFDWLIEQIICLQAKFEGFAF